jgi:hypothetical protein
MPEGRCLCGATAFAFERPENWAAHCWCESCRRASGAAVVAFVGVDDGRWRWTGAPPAVFHSSPGVARMFCPRCGASVAYRAARFSGEIHFHAALLDDPADFRPRAHVHWDERVPWLAPADDLPRRGLPGA